jgi:hypothetical protein
MKTRTSIGTGVVAVISATLLTLSSASAGAARPEARGACPAIDTEPLCELVRHHSPASDGATAGAGLVGSTQTHAHANGHIRCPGHRIYRVVACAG